MRHIRWFVLGMIFVITLSAIAPADVLAAAAKTAGTPACDSRWYEPAMTVVPQGRITVKGQAQPVYYQVGLEEELYSSDAALDSGSVTRVYNTLKQDNQTYYAIGGDKYVKANSNLKYEKVPTSIRNCMLDAVADYNVKTWVAEAKMLKTPLTKLIFLFQRLDEHVTYDYPLYNGTGGDPLSYTSTGALANGLAVCEGYATALALLLTKVGIENKTITGLATNGIGTDGHMWNLVKLDGLYYHVDPTWGDDYIGQFHYFLLPDQDMKRNHYWSMKTYATSDKYAFFDRISNAFNLDLVNGTYDEIGYSGGIERKKLADKSTVRITPAGDRVYGAPQVYNGELYYLTDRGLKKVSLDGSNAQFLDKPEGAVNHFIVFNNKVYYTSLRISFDEPYAFKVFKSGTDGSNPELAYTFTEMENHNFRGFYVAKDGAHSTLYCYTDDHQLIRMDSF
ncbi:transglutaminase domain-containing protein [Paenibacillus kobensis]|uniref:transglutaminase domain-containing protein n=1 Tax=Paenibacillus kobensis TaxID=59841 RepID=UPI0013E31B21|nr:transglutaminase-like domain-containing protein [Paenibacillus kobensis]